MRRTSKSDCTPNMGMSANRVGLKSLVAANASFVDQVWMLNLRRLVVHTKAGLNVVYFRGLFVSGSIDIAERLRS